MAPTPITEDFYMILEVDQTATTEVITKSYRRLALKHHPDRNADRDTTAAFQLLGKAYETLKDEQKRLAYDLLYPSIRRRHTTSSASRPSPTSDPPPPPEPPSETIQIAKLEKAKQDRRAQWLAGKKIFESSIFELQRDIRRIENEIKVLNDISAAEAAQEARDNSWGRWLLSPIYKKAPVSEEEKANIDRRKQERRVEKDMKERRLDSKQADLEKQENLMKNREAEVNGADIRDDWKIRSLQTKIRERETRAREEREAKERAQREAEEAEARKRQQERWERWRREAEEQAKKRQAEAEKQAAEYAAAARKRQEEAEEELRKRHAEYAAAARRRQEDQDRAWARARRRGSFDDEAPHISRTVGCIHDGWWPKVQGRKACPRCSEIWTYLLECPECKMKACPKCQAEVRPRRRNPNRW
ncbi:DnaJ domain-containing protein [Xylaria sp. FL0933]|nr:DnaJ domain-containing protein [Xylaria sp. FL0933]